MGTHLFRRALAATLVIASAIVVAPVTTVFAAPVPTATITPASTTPMIGETTTLTLTFDNTSATDVGYGPYIDLRLPIAGADGNDGLSFSAATYLGAAVVPRSTTTCTGATMTHPLTGAAVACALGQQLVVLQLPFGSFTATQPPAPLTVIATMSDLADIGTPLSVTATPGFAYGTTPTGSTPVIGTASTVSLTPRRCGSRRRTSGPSWRQRPDRTTRAASASRWTSPPDCR